MRFTSRFTYLHMRVHFCWIIVFSLLNCFYYICKNDLAGESELCKANQMLVLHMGNLVSIPSNPNALQGYSGMIPEHKIKS